MFIVSAGAKLSLHTTRQKLLWLPLNVPDLTRTKWKLFRSTINIYFERHTERESDRYIGCIEPPPLISLKKKKEKGVTPSDFLRDEGGKC